MLYDILANISLNENQLYKYLFSGCFFLKMPNPVIIFHTGVIINHCMNYFSLFRGFIAFNFQFFDL